LTNVRVTTGILGPDRKDAKDPKVLPGDLLVVSFDINGLTVKDDGRVRFSMGFELLSKGKTKPVFAHAPEIKESFLSLGGSRLPSLAQATIGTDTKPGEYAMKVTVTDVETKKTQVLEQKFEVIPAQLGFVRVGLTYDAPTYYPAPAIGVPGQTLLLHFSLVGFELDKKNNPDVNVSMVILDEATGKPTVAKPNSGDVKMIASKEFETIIPFDPIPIQINRPGKYTITIKATDRHNKKTADQSISLTVADTK